MRWCNVAEGLRIWVLPDPETYGITATDMQLLGVGIAFYEAEILIPTIPPSGGISGRWSGKTYRGEKPKNYELERLEAIRKDDQDFLDILKIIAPLILN